MYYENVTNIYPHIFKTTKVFSVTHTTAGFFNRNNVEELAGSILDEACAQENVKKKMIISWSINAKHYTSEIKFLCVMATKVVQNDCKMHSPNLHTIDY